MNNQQSLPDIIELLKRTWEIYKKRYLILAGIMVIPFIFRIILGSAVPGNLSLISSILLFSISSWASAAIIFAIKEKDQKSGIQEAFSKSLKIIVPVIIVSILTYIIIFIGFILLVIPGIIFAVWYGFSIFVLIFEDLRGMAALSRSKQLASGYTLDIFIKFLVGGLSALAVMLLPLILITILIGGAYAGDIIGLFMWPFLMIYSLLIYENLKKIKGGSAESFN